MPYRPPAASPPRKKPPAGKPPAPSEISSGLPPPQKRPGHIPSHPEAPSPEDARATFQPSFTGPPIPLLQKYGYSGSIFDFNKRVAGIVSAFSDRFGKTPSWGHVFNAAVSQIDNFQDLYAQVPRSTSEAIAQKSLVQHKASQPYNYFTQDANGVPAINNPIMEMVRKNIAENPQLQNSPSGQRLEKLDLLKASKQYPTVRAGEVIPLSFGMDSLVNSLNNFDKYVGPGRAMIVKENGIDLAAFNRIYKKANQGDRNQLNNLSSDARTLYMAQKELNEKMGTSLPVTGIFNDDWLKALHNWMTTPAYFRQAALYQSHAAGFGDNYSAFYRSWQFKQHAVNRHGFAKYFIAAMPLHVFSHGGGFGLAHGVFDDIFRPESLGISTPLHALTHTAGLALSGIGGSVTEGKAYLGAGTAAINAMAPVIGKGKTFAQAKQEFRDTLVNKNPSWLRVLYPDLAPHPKGILGKVDAVTNIAGDLLLLRKPAFTGEFVEAGNIGAAAKSTYVRAASHWAYQDLREGNLGRAASMLEGGAGSERLVAHTRKLVQSGRMSEEQFTHHVAELYAKGETDIGYGLNPSENGAINGVRALPKGSPARALVGEGAERGRTVIGPTLTSLGLKTVPAPGARLLRSKNAIRDSLDTLDKSLRRSNLPLTDAAATLASKIRAEFSHAVPKSSRNYFDPKLPERVHDFVVKEFGDAGLANKFESDLVRYRATENISAIQKLNDKLDNLYAKKYPDRPSGAPGDPFAATLVSEAPSRFELPSGGFREVNTPLDWFANSARRANFAVNRAASYAARLIIAGIPFPPPLGGMSLFWKHAVGDTLRRVVAQDGIIFTGPEVKRAQREIEAFANANPGASRALGVFRKRVSEGEVRYVLNRGGYLQAEGARSFATGEKFAKNNYMEAAGGFLRRRVDDDALAAYTKSSESDLSPLVNLIQQNRHYRGLYERAKKSETDLTQEDYAQLIWNQYHGIADAASAQGISDVFGQAQGVLFKNRGVKADKALGEFIKENRLDFRVHGAEVERVGTFDQYSTWAISKIMVLNKWNRSTLGERTMAQLYSKFRKAGWDEHAAFETAMAGAEKTVIYHMLDFSNRLQIEQDLRWLSYFATKHRLYWKWVVATFARHPGYAAAVSDLQQHLDNGNLNFKLPGGISLPILGSNLSIPVARLVWVPGRDYSEVSPLAQAIGGLVKGNTNVAESAKGTFGNIFTRSDTGLHLAAKLAGIAAGVQPASYHAAAAGLDEKTKARLYKSFNDYQNEYFDDHGHYAPESEVVKHVLLAASGEELWRANLPLPVVPQYDQNAGHKLLVKYLQITDPSKRRAFLDKNPDLETYFGIFRDPATYLHSREYWRAFNTARDQFRNERRGIYEQAQREGYSAKLKNQANAAGAKYGAAINALLLRDASQTGKLTEEGKKLLASGKDLSNVNPDEFISKRGTWGKSISVDPFVDPRGAVGKLFPKLSSQQLEKGVPGFDVKQARLELKLLRSPYAAKTYGTDPEAESQIKTRIGELLQFIQDFKSYPHDALASVQDEYQTKYANPFWDQYNKRFTAIANLPKGKKELAYAEFRAWRDQQDKPVVVKGIKFPSPIRMAWASLDPQTRKQRLAKIADSEWGHLANYEKELLTGKKVPSHVSDAWEQFDKALSDYRTQNPGQRVYADQKIAVVKELNRYYPGFLNDYLFSLQNKERRFEATKLYQDMPSPVKTKYDQYIGTIARSFTKQLGAASYSKSEASGIWRNYIDQQVTPWLNDPAQARLKKELALYGPDFLYSLVS